MGRGVLLVWGCAGVVMVAVAVGLWGEAARADGPERVTFTETERKRILRHAPLGAVPADETNRVADDPRAARLGHLLFFDKRLSGNGEISCASCHDPQRGFVDGKAIAEGAGVGERNTPTLWNVAYHRWYFWDGRADTLWGQAVRPIERPIEMDGNRVRVARVIAGDRRLRRLYERVFGDLPAVEGWPENARPATDEGGVRGPWTQAWQAMGAGERAAATEVLVNVAKALAAYERKLVRKDAPFDRFVEGLRAGDREKQQALSASAKRGLKIFVGEGNCRFCHMGPNFSDGEFHSVRVPPRGGDVPTDPGRFAGAWAVKADPFNARGSFSDQRTGKKADQLKFLANGAENWGRFKTPSLRNVALTAPYMHQGQFATLDEVIDYYSTLKDALPAGHHGGGETILRPLGLRRQERADLKAFLESLTGEGYERDWLMDPWAGDEER